MTIVALTTLIIVLIGAVHGAHVVIATPRPDAVPVDHSPDRISRSDAPTGIHRQQQRTPHTQRTRSGHPVADRPFDRFADAPTATPKPPRRRRH